MSSYIIKTVRTDSEQTDFVELVQHLDSELAERDGSEHSFYAQFNTIVNIRHVVVAYEQDTPIACGAIKEYSSGTAEVKRMYTVPSYRGQGIASIVLRELEQWAKELSYKTCILETGKQQPEAIALYAKNGYKVIGNYGQYAGVENSVCFEKVLSS